MPTRRSLLKAAGLSVSAGLAGCSGNEGESEKRPERETESPETQTEWDQIDSELESLEDDVREVLEGYRQNTEELRTKYRGFLPGEDDSILNGSIVVDQNEELARIHPTVNSNFAPDENFLEDKTVYNDFMNASTFHELPDSWMVDSEALDDKVSEMNCNIRIPQAAMLNQEAKEKFLKSPRHSRKDTKKAKNVLNSLLRQGEQLGDVISQKKEEISDENPQYERLEGMESKLIEAGSEAFSLYTGAKMMESMSGRELIQSYDSSKQCLRIPGIYNGNFDFNGDGKIDRKDVNTLSWLMKDEAFQQVLGRRVGSGERATTDDLHRYQKDSSVFKGETDDSYRIFFDEERKGAPKGLKQVIRAADLIAGGSGNPEIQTVEDPLTIEGYNGKDIFKEFNKKIGQTPDTDYNMLIHGTEPGDETTDFIGYSEIGGPGYPPSEMNAGVIFDKEDTLVDYSSNPVPIVSSGMSITHVGVHEIRHAQGFEHSEVTSMEFGEEGSRYSVANVMYSGEAHSQSQVKSDESEDILYSITSMSDKSPLW